MHLKAEIIVEYALGHAHRVTAASYALELNDRRQCKSDTPIKDGRQTHWYPLTRCVVRPASLRYNSDARSGPRCVKASESGTQWSAVGGNVALYTFKSLV